MFKMFLLIMFIVVNGMYYSTHQSLPPYGDMLTSVEYTITTYLQGL